MKLHCPHCGVKGSAEDSYLGRKVKCPKCNGIFSVQPEMALELSEIAALDTPAPTESSLPAEEVATSPLTDVVTGDTREEAQAPVEAEEQIVIDEDLDEPEAASSQEETPVWEDVADGVEKQEEYQEPPMASPGEEIVLEDDFADTAGDIDLPGEETGVIEEDEVSEEIVVIEEDTEADIPAQAAAADVPEADESVVVAEEDAEGEPEVQTESDEETREVEEEPYGIDQKQCWQCGKKEGIGESFIAKDGRLYCVDCVPAEEPAESTGTGQNGVHPAPLEDVANGADDTPAPKGLFGKVWSKIKKALS